MAPRLLIRGGMPNEQIRDSRATGERAPERATPVLPVLDNRRVVPFEDDEDPEVEDIDLDNVVAID